MDEAKIFWFPTLLVVLVTGVWLLAGRGFGAGDLLPHPSQADTLAEMEANLRIQWKLAEAGGTVRNWMWHRIVCWPRSAGQSMATWMFSLFAHPLMHVGILSSVLAVGSLGLLAMSYELRAGGFAMMAVVTSAYILNAVVFLFQPVDAPVVGCWGIIAALAAVLVISRSDDSPAIGSRVLGALVVVCLVLNVPETLGGTPVFVAQWLPGMGGGLLMGMLHRLMAS